MNTRNLLFTFLFSLFFCTLLPAKPILTKNKKYRIVCLGSNTQGSFRITSQNGVNSLIYDKSSDIQSDSAYWYIMQVTTQRYSFKNVATQEYLHFKIPNNKEGMQLSASLKKDSTRFILEKIHRNGLSYYGIVSPIEEEKQHCVMIRPATNNVGTYFPYNQSNFQLFAFIGAEDNVQVEDDELYGDLNDYTNYFHINGKELVRDKKSGIYYFPLPTAQLGSNMTKEISFELKGDIDRVYIDNKRVTSGSEFTFENVRSDTTYSIRFSKGLNDIAVAQIVFTGLPIVQLYCNGYLNGYFYTPGSTKIHDPSTNLPAELLHAKFRYRGATAQGYPKKAFAVKLTDENGTKIDKSFFGFREDNNWILDAMAIDPARMRNRVSFDLWNDFAHKPYYQSAEPEMTNGTHGTFVELFINDEYNGLYCMTEKIDRKQLKLKKYQPETQNIRGVLYKSSDWSFATLMGNTPDRGNTAPNTGQLRSYNNNSETWDGYEVKYPDLGDGEPIDWSPLYNTVKFAAFASDQNFIAEVENWFDMPVLIDYYLFIELMLATDNHGKNMFLSVYNTNNGHKTLITPWDLDGTWGRRWSGDDMWGSGSAYPEQDFISFLHSNEHGEYRLFYRLKTLNAKNFNTKLKERYTALRQSWFNPDKLIDRFVKYNTQFVKAGTAQRELEKWSSMTPRMNFNYEMTYISNWIKRRIAYLDKQYGLGSGIETIEIPTLNMAMLASTSQLLISNLEEGDQIQIFNAEGKLLLTQPADNYESVIDMSRYPAGSYIVKAGQKSGKFVKP